MTTANGDKAGEGTSGVASGSRDSFLWGFPLSMIACLMALVTSFYLEKMGGDWFFVGIFLFLITAVYALVLLVMTILALVSARLKQALAFVLGPVILVLAFVWHLIWIFVLPLDLLRLYYHRGEYEAVIDKMSPAERASTAVFFDWGNAGGGLTSPTFYYLAYDESGQIALSDAERTQEWKDKAYAEASEIDRCRTTVYRIIGHYYSVASTCQ